MNHWHNDFMAEYHRQDLVKESEKIHLENIALESRVYRTGLFAKTMHSLASWMILTGKKLHARFEIPTVHCHQTRSNSFAR